MRRRFRGNLAFALTAGVAWTLGGCTTPHHSNALIFGTNTSFGIDVGQNATGVPSILIGYRRQEAVFMPLVANVAYDANGVPTPCNVYPGGAANLSAAVPGGDESATSAPVPACFLVGQNGGAIDSYSVLASFGAQFSASATNPAANGGLAQFFATGLAAQALAIKGGSSLVAVGTAATVTGATNANDGIRALYNAPEVTAGREGILAGVPASQAALADYVTGQTTDADVLTKLTALEVTAGVPPGTLTPTICATANRANCVTQVNGVLGGQILGLYNVDWKAAIARQIQAGAGQ